MKMYWFGLFAAAIAGFFGSRYLRDLLADHEGRLSRLENGGGSLAGVRTA